MDKRVGFWLLVAVVAAVTIAGPVKHLRSGVVEYKRISYPRGKRLTRRHDPAKFYLYVASELLFMLAMLWLAYSVIFHSNASP